MTTKTCFPVVIPENNGLKSHLAPELLNSHASTSKDGSIIIHQVKGSDGKVVSVLIAGLFGQGYRNCSNPEPGATLATVDFELPRLKKLQLKRSN